MAINGQGPACLLEGVDKRFAAGGREVHALKQVSASIPRGVVTGLVGPDAAGKTTLLRLCVGLMAPDAGDITVMGRELPAGYLAVQAAVGYMPQRFGLYEDLTVQENLNLYADLRELPPKERQARYDQLLDMTGMAAFTGRLAGALSGGMKQKLGLACALVKPTEMLVLDEPTVGVDPVSRRELWEIVYTLVEDEGLSVVISTSYLDEAERCQEVILMHEGEVLGQGDPKDYSRSMEGRSFLVSHPQGRRRAIQKALFGKPGVVDTLIQGAGVRLVMAEDVRPELATLAPDEDGLTINETPPRFEDAFMSLLAQRRDEVRESELHAQEVEGSREDEVIKVDQLTKRFGDFTAVNAISFAVKRGEIFGLLGANGAGKSTTFRMLCGLLTPTGGELTVAGRNLRKAPARVRAKIGYMAQHFSLYTQLGVAENLRFFASAYGLRGGRRQKAVDWALNEFGLGELAATASGDLPLGYKQRLSLAAALMHQPEILFLDEPTSGVDPLARRDFWRRINALAELGVTVLVTTHFMEEAEYCDRLVIMDQGEILAQGAPMELKERFKDDDHPNPTLEDAFIAVLDSKHQERKEAA